MAEDFVIGLDSSTTSVKAIAFDRRGNVVARAGEPLPLFSPQPNYYEQNPDDWWTAARTALRRVTARLDPTKIRALAVSNQRETFVALDRSGAPLRPAIVWLDERCKGEVEGFARRIGRREIHRITGKPVDYAPVVYRLAWMKKKEPKLFRRIGTICDVQSYLVRKLTGEFKTSWSSADPFGLFDLKKKRWSPAILNALDLNENQLPQTFRTGTVLGTLTGEAARLTGLTAETIVAAGGGDGQCAGLGSNILAPERAYLNLGTAVVAGIYGENYRVSEVFRTMASCSDGGYYFECSLRAGTFAVDWFVKNVLKIDPLENPSIYRELEAEAGPVGPGSGGLFHLPYLCGVMNPYWDGDAAGAFVGLTAAHRRGHLYRAILEGIAFEQLFAVDAVEKVNRRRVAEFAVIGGGATSDLWLQILADVTNKKINIPENTEASSLGAAIAAGVGAGWFTDFREAAGQMCRVGRVVEPDPASHRQYRKAFSIYKKIYPALKTVGI
ncbi:MAG: FGGY-family carbohydrate kinase [Acidobacteria bacterium]|nr:FGGY-family carbohydrate kinase [Acidobacteriota bacterium]